MNRSALITRVVSALLLIYPALAGAASVQDLPATAREMPGQVRGGDAPVTYDHGDWVVVPIPVLNPVLKGGVILGLGYFHPQTPEQAAAQPASVSGGGIMRTSNGSQGVLVAHQGYLEGDRWRYGIGGGKASVNADLVAPEDTGGLVGVDWEIEGWAAAAEVDRRIGDTHMYIGLIGRILKADQSFGVYVPPLDDRGFELGNTIKAVGVGMDFIRDTRDLTTNPSSGTMLKLKYLANAKRFGGDSDYQTREAYLRLYRGFSDSLVLAGELRACRKTGDVPLWDACTLSLRGFPATDHMVRGIAQARIEARWQILSRWGIAAFGGRGWITESFLGDDADDTVSNHGLGLRFTVLPSKKLNLRVDYGRSGDKDAWYVSVGEAF